jgi:hypothetical protein
MDWQLAIAAVGLVVVAVGLILLADDAIYHGKSRKEKNHE